MPSHRQQRASADGSSGRLLFSRFSRMMRFMLSVIALCWGVVGASCGDCQAEVAVDFQQQIAPLLEQHCVRCHSPGNRKGEVSLATFDDLQRNEFVIPGKPDESHLITLVTSQGGQPAAMPQKGEPLSPTQVDLLRKWIASGALWPADVIVKERSRGDANWWSLQPLAGAVSGDAGATSIAAKPSRSIDDFIGERLAEQKLSRNPPADRRTLIRRVTYDLIGLPPTPAEVEAFVHDEHPQAYEHLIDRLLASPHYGERWGRHWLDIVRFGESIGYERNVIVNDLWPFRDFVIRSINEDKPFDQFIREHLAGDVIGKDDPAVVVGSAFLVAGPYDDVGNQDAAQAAQIRANTLDEIIRATGEGFLGMTLGCSRCHDHKFDPITQQDYYGLYATFSGVRHGSVKWTDVIPQLTTETSSPTVWIGRRVDADAKGPFHTFIGGNPQQPGSEVTPASLEVLTPSRGSKPATTASDSNLDRSADTEPAADENRTHNEGEFPSNTFAYRLPANAPESERRLAFANWVVHPDNPLTPRVLANRLWHYHFGTGIVDTPSDFGYMGGRPSHPELLDFLAVTLKEHHWQIKPLHRLIMTSQTYQQSSAFRADAAQIYSDARLLWRFPPRRLAAEEVRDTLLHISGKLETRAGGPGFRLYRFMQDNVCTYVPLDEHPPVTYRRAVYHQNARASVVDLMTEFDQPDCTLVVPKRSVTTTPLQALTMLNHRFTLDMSAALETRLQREAGDDSAAQIRHAYQLCYSRDPTASETAECLDFLKQFPLRSLCRVLLNTSELISIR